MRILIPANCFKPYGFNYPAKREIFHDISGWDFDSCVEESLYFECEIPKDFSSGLLRLVWTVFVDKFYAGPHSIVWGVKTPDLEEEIVDEIKELNVIHVSSSIRVSLQKHATFVISRKVASPKDTSAQDVTLLRAEIHIGEENGERNKESST